MDVLFTPPLAFVIYIVLVGMLVGIGRLLSEASSSSNADTSLYASGESSEKDNVVPGYRPFFLTALFFAMLHLGVIVLATGGMSIMSAVFLLALMLALLALILG